MTPAYLLELFTTTLKNRCVKRLSKVALHQLVMETKPPLADTSSRLMTEILAQIPELEITDAFISLRKPGDKMTGETLTPIANTIHTPLTCLGDNFAQNFNKQGLFWLPTPQWAQVVTATHDYFQNNDYQPLGSRPELRDKLQEHCNNNIGGTALPQEIFNRLISSLLRSQAMIIYQPSAHRRTWILKAPFRSPDLLSEHLMIFLLYRGIQNGFTCSPREWSLFLFGDADHIDHIDALKIQIFSEGYAEQFELRAPATAEVD
jgi:hypothetical protein